ncbi:bifunctional metallophosphatase/5'-nucleotidase [Parabacteroides chinchillae]|uniref:2',3'-cyclic-nucleotide 2'-phosphodiesterase / 3'-nucleotidase n=1 Tax=Parabacteroides chinchillae TaxID=871327 RepID=A0A8G2BZ20_9BACT|nr:5'-nucleotidase C-terminal domain-containing protein [Parabacteroides chinchillae]SEG27323.1 2',3'-cyclic-nucleotide 2'-phosphodiesterase / 3'-nucleotidase [Parabacteroides chinchillae]
MKRTAIVFVLLLIFYDISAAIREVKLRFIETSDIHGNYFPYNFIDQHEWGGSLARVCNFVQGEREIYGENLILIDNGDILQGQPSAYYYNYIDTASIHIAADMMNYMKYDIGNMGNHDVETGHTVYDRWIRQCNFPVLGANIIRTSDESTYLKPYHIIQRDGIKIAVLGMITPAIPAWLSENLWKGLRFEDMEATARKWIKIIREKESPDIIVGVFHSGKDASTMMDKYRENASAEVARNVSGFDFVLMGHDHRRACEKILNADGDSILIIDPASNGRLVACVDVVLTLDDKVVEKKNITGRLIDIDTYEPSKEFMQRFNTQYDIVKNFVSRKIGSFTETINTRPAYFGSSAFIDFIHTLQLQLTGAEISFAAPLSFDATIYKGDVKVSDMFNLYKYENMLYTMMLSGTEIKGYLEESYALWSNYMKSPSDHLLLLTKKEGDDGRCTFTNFSFNFDSASGIIYTVDVTKPAGEKVTILSMADRTPFEMNKMYKVALNSYRGNGGGELLTKGAGIPVEQLKDRIIASTDKDLRFYLMKYIEEKKVLSPQPMNHWMFVPIQWAVPAARRDSVCLFGEN